MSREERIGRKNYRTLIKAVIILVILFIVFITFILLCKTKEYVIEGNTRYSDNEIMEYLVKDKISEYAPLLYLKHKFFDDTQIPFIEYIDIEMTSLNSVKIYVYEKILCGCVTVMGRYMYFDKDGIVTESSNAKDPEIPVISGLSFDNIVIGKKLEVQNDELFGTILDLTLAVMKYNCNVDEIHFNTDLSVIFHCGNSRAYMGRRSSYDEVIMALTAMLPESGGKALEYDLRNYDSSDKTVIARPIDDE